MRFPKIAVRAEFREAAQRVFYAPVSSEERLLPVPRVFSSSRPVFPFNKVFPESIPSAGSESDRKTEKVVWPRRRQLRRGVFPRKLKPRSGTPLPDLGHRVS